MNKNLKKRALSVLKKVYETPTLPEHILILQNNIIIRIFRFLSGLSIISLLLINKIDLFTKILGTGIFLSIFKSLCLIFIFFFNIYLFYINYHRFIHMYKMVKSGKLEIRNSP